jgi:hypothetical protein
MYVKHIAVMMEARTIEPKRFDALMLDMLELRYCSLTDST